MHGIVGEAVGIVRIGMPAGEPDDPLRQQVFERVPHLAGLPVVDEAPREAIDQAVPSLGRVQQYGTPIRARVLLIEGGDEGAIEEVRKENSLWYRPGGQRKRLRGGERTCGNGFLPCGGICVSPEIGPFVNFPG